MISGAHYFHGYDLMSLSFQPAATNSMHGIIAFHEDLMVILTFILGVVLYMLFITIYMFNQNKIDAEKTTTPLNHAPLLELI
jgi:heme/copper-type cytochrome/quinol oxidase subunit 2